MKIFAKNIYMVGILQLTHLTLLQYSDQIFLAKNFRLPFPLFRCSMRLLISFRTFRVGPEMIMLWFGFGRYTAYLPQCVRGRQVGFFCVVSFKEWFGALRPKKVYRKRRQGDFGLLWPIFFVKWHKFALKIIHLWIIYRTLTPEKTWRHNTLSA